MYAHHILLANRLRMLGRQIAATHAPSADLRRIWAEALESLADEIDGQAWQAPETGRGLEPGADAAGHVP